jgi:type IV pilus assembly protein PilM
LFEGILGIKKPIFGLDIGYQTMKVVEVKGKGKGTRILGVAEVPIPANSLGKEGVKEPQKIAQIIKEAVKTSKPHAISARIVSCALPESLVFTKSLSLPKMSVEDLNKNIPYQATEFFPIPAEETYMDWQIVGDNKDNKTVEVLVVAAPKALVNSLIETVKMAGYETMGMETKPVAVTRALIDPLDPGPYLICDIGAKTTGLTCYDQGSIKLTSTVAAGGDEIQADFSNSLKTISSEIIHLIKYYQNRVGQAQVFRKIILAGGGANIDKVNTTIEGLTKIKTEISFPRINSKTYDPKFAAAIGLAMKNI